MYHADKNVTVYHKEWDEKRGADVYRKTVLKGVSFFSKIATSVSTDGLTAACEGTLRIPTCSYPKDLVLTSGDLLCEGDVQMEIHKPSDLNGLCSYVFTVVGITHNRSGRCPHTKVVCK